MRDIKRITQARFAKWGEELMPVVLPHTWNNLDGQDGGNDYWRGVGTYKIDLPNPTAGKKQYIEFQGANHVATVYFNGRELGTHKGGFSTFRYDLTPAMKKEGNVLTVAVSNAISDIYPQLADFTFYGGLYRDVNFIEVGETHFDLLKDGTSGVFVTPHCTGNTRLDLFPVNADGAVIAVELKDAEGNVVGRGGVEASAHTHLLIEVDEPHLWHGIEDPYCYTAVASIVKGEEVLDTVEVTYGYHSFNVDPNTGFWLNGKNVPLRGVSRHQDRQDKGWALSKEDHEEDIALMKELGANTITAKSGNLEDTITLNGVDKHNDAYTIPDLAEALQIGNWFDEIVDDSDSDEIEIIDGYYSIDDTLEILLSNEECLKIVKGWCMKNGDLTGVSTLTALRDMVGFVKIDSPIIPLAKVSKKQYAQLNRQLNKIKK